MKQENIVPKYHLKDYVRYYRSYALKNGIPCNFFNEEKGYITAIEYVCDVKGEIKLNYIVGKYVGSFGGSVVSEEMIIEKVKPEIEDFGHKQYLESSIKANELKIVELRREIKRMKKELEEKYNDD